LSTQLPRKAKKKLRASSFQVLTFTSQNPTRSLEFWYWVSLHLCSYFEGRSCPPFPPSMDEPLQRAVEIRANYYQILSTLLFQAERFIKLEAQEIGIGYPFESFSGLFYELIREDYICEQSLLQQTCYEFPSVAKQQEHIRESIKFLEGGKAKEAMLVRWEKEDLRLNRTSEFDPDKYRLLNNLCSYTFYKYKRKIPGYDAWTSAIKQMNSLISNKIAVLDGVPKAYPGRGKGKAKVS
jgi:hypothetical protein